jgi:hypothetical protein
MSQVYSTPSPWNSQRPQTLVIACSDGRLQENLDAFLHRSLGITHYDRLYAPGGGGVLAPGGYEHMRADHFCQECRFLLRAHSVKDLLLIFHGPAEDGPDEAACADYRRKMPGASMAELRRQQDEDARAARAIDWGIAVQVQAYRCEVTASQAVQFVPM